EAAQRYAKQSDAVAGTFTFGPFSDSPSKVLKELEALKQKAPTPPAATQKVEPVNRLDSMKGMLGLGPKVDAPQANGTTTSNKPGDTLPAPTNTDKARAILVHGRQSLEENNFTLAKQCADQAKALKPTLDRSEDTPEKLLADVVAAEKKKTAEAV